MKCLVQRLQMQQKKSADTLLQNSQLMGVVGSGIKNILKNTNSESQDNKRQDVKTLDEMKATDCGVLISNITKTQDAKKYERICKNLNEESKKKFDDLSPEDKDVILKIFKMNLDLDVPIDLGPGPQLPSPPPVSSMPSEDLEISPPPQLAPASSMSSRDQKIPPPPQLASIMSSPRDIEIPPSLVPRKASSRGSSFDKKNPEVINTILNNLIEIFTNDAYSDLKNYYSERAKNGKNLNVEVLINCQVCDIKNYINKANLSVEDFFINNENFMEIMSAISNANLENEEIKNQVKENLYELSNNENLKKISLLEQDILPIIEFLRDKDEKIAIMEKRSILNQLKLFDGYEYMYSEYNVKEKLEVFNTLVKLIPENESFLNYKDKIINCVKSVEGCNAYEFLENVLKPNIKTIEKDFKTLLDRMVKWPYQGFKNELYCAVIFDKEYKYHNTSPFILSLILRNADDKTTFEDLYNKYQPMLQKADDKTVSNMTGDMFPYLDQFRELFNKIQVNEEEDIYLESLSYQQLKELQVFLKKNTKFPSFENMNMNFLNKNFEKIFIKNDNKIDYASTLSEVNKLLVAKHLDLPKIQKDNINNILDVKNDLAKINFEKIKIDLGKHFGRGKQFIIKASNTSRENKYIQSAKLNGKKLNSFKFPAKELLKGGTLELEMGDRPNKNWGIK